MADRADACGQTDAMAPAELDRKLFAAVERLGRALRSARQQHATRHGLSLLGVQILETLADGRPRRVGRLAAELDLTQATVSDALTVLGARELVSRGRDPDDGRATVVALTGAGAELATTIAADLAPILHGETDDRDAGARAGALRVVLGEIARLHAAGVIAVDRSCLTCQHYRPPSDRRRPHCLLLDMPLSDDGLRVDCPEHLERRHPTPV